MHLNCCFSSAYVYSQPSASAVYTATNSTNHGLKNVPKKRKIVPILNIYRLVFLAIIFSTLRYNYLHSIFIALGIVSNLKTI